MEEHAGTKALPPVDPGSEPRVFLAVAALLLLALGYLTVAGISASSPLSTYGDLSQVALNPLLTPERHWYEVFVPSPQAQYVPVTLLSLKLNYAVFGRDAAWSFRVINWLLHAASGIVLLLVVSRLGLRRLEALFLAAAWTAHPMACESVAWVTQRSNCLAVLFGMCGLAAYLVWHGRWRGQAGAVVGFLLALLSKPSALGWLPVFVALEMVGGPSRLSARSSSDSGAEASGGWGKAILRLAPLVVLAAIFTVLGVQRAGIGQMPPPGGHWYTALMTDTEIFARYLYNVFLPFGLSAFYGVEDIVSPADARLYAHVLALGALVGLSVWAARSRRRAVFGWLWFFGALAPHANLIGAAFPMQDRYVYLSSIGALLVAVETGAGLWERWGAQPVGQGHFRLAAQTLPAAYVALLGLLSVGRSLTWDNTLSLFREAAERQPRSALARAHCAVMLGQTAAALRHPALYDPMQAASMSREALEQYAAAQDCPDLYRYSDPMGLAVQMAREAVQIGRSDEARRILAGHVPVVSAPEGEPADAEPAGGWGLVKRGEHTYRYNLLLLAQGHVVRAEANLLEFGEDATAAQRAWECVEQADRECDSAARVRPEHLDAYFVKAKTRLLLEPPAGVLAPQADPARRLEQARTVLFSAGPHIEDHRRSPAARAAFGPPVPPSRVRALGRLALAEWELFRARKPDCKPAEAQASLESAMRHARAAEELDPSYADPPYIQAHIRLEWDRFCVSQGNRKEAREHFEKASELLQKVPVSSPRHRDAQFILSRLVPPPPPAFTPAE